MPTGWPPSDPRAVAGLKAELEDADGGLVAITPGLTPAGYQVIVLETFEVSPSEIKDQDDLRLAKDMSAYLHGQLASFATPAAIRHCSR